MTTFRSLVARSAPAWTASPRTAALLLLALAALPLRAQIVLPNPGESLPTFEVSTVKPSRSDLGRSFHVSTWWNDNSYSTLNTTLRDLIRDAFDIRSAAQLTGGPDALLDTRFDLSAKVADDDYAALQKLPREERSRQFYLMRQALLADRFGLKYHIETRVLPVFDLVVEKSGPKLQPWSPEPSPTASADASPTQSPADLREARPPVRPAPVQGSHMRIGRSQASMTVTGEPISNLVRMLHGQPDLAGRLLVDKTGLTGLYSFNLQWSPQRLGASPDPDATAPSLFDALKEQLGLRLQPAKAPTPVLVIDALNPPTPN